jgi:hypothetical protein
MNDPNQLALFDIGASGEAVCVECKLPPPTKWCWGENTDCPLGIPLRFGHQWVSRW